MKSSVVTVRPIRPEEFTVLGDVLAAAYLALENASEPDWYIDRLRDVEGRATASCVLAAVDGEGRVLGGVTYVSGPEDPYSEDLGEGEAGIRMLAVDPAMQRRGAGAALVAACIERARTAGRRRIVLHTGTYMADAQRLYTRFGFRRAPSLDWQPVPGLQLLGYVLDL